MRSLRLLTIALAVALLGAVGAQAELTAKGDLFVLFEGGIVPRSLPRSERAPIEVNISGLVKTPYAENSPALRKITIALNRGGHLDTEGLPVCNLADLQSTKPQAALAACRPALVGGGSFTAETDYPDQETFASGGRILAFNGRNHGHPAILAHIYGTQPLQSIRIVTFSMRKVKRGPFGIVLTGNFPARLIREGTVKKISLSLRRTFTYQGQRHSYLSAACAAPKGFSQATFPFARAAMTFSDKRTLSTTLTRSCNVRG
jgi:hypothetical protein